MTETVPVHSDIRSFTKANMTQNVHEQQCMQPNPARQSWLEKVFRLQLQGQIKCMSKQDGLDMRISQQHKLK